MFYLTKIIGGKPRHYLYEAYRDKKTGKPKRRMVAYLSESRTVQSRIKALSKKANVDIRPNGEIFVFGDYDSNSISEIEKLQSILKHGACPKTRRR